MYRIDERQSPNTPGFVDGPAHIVDGPQCIRGRANRDQFSLLTDRLFELGPVKFPCGGNHSDGLHGHATLFCQPPPGVDVRVMIEFRHNQFVTWTKLRTQRSAEMICESCHVGAEGNLVAGGVEEFCADFPRMFERCVSFFAGRVSPVGVRIVVIEIVAHLFDHLPGYLGASWTVKVGDVPAVMYSLERWKV